MENFEKIKKSISGFNASLLIINKKDGVYDVPFFLHQAKEIMGEKSYQTLIDNGIIIENGSEPELSSNIMEYKGYTLHYQKIAEGEYKSLILLLDTQTLEGQRIAYHEMGHLYQSKSTGLALINTFFDDNKNFTTHFLEEAHAELFAAACILKDAKNEDDFQSRKEFLYKQAVVDEELGKRSNVFTYPSPKFYAHLSLIKNFLSEVEMCISNKSYLAIAKELERHAVLYNRKFFIGAENR